MIEVIPVMLFILGWHPEQPGDIDLQRPEVVFLSMEECEFAGAEMALRMTEAAKKEGQKLFSHRCVEFPPREEFDEAFQQFDASQQ